MPALRTFPAILLLASLLPCAIARAAPDQRDWRGEPRFHDPSTPILQGKTWFCFSTGNGISIRTSPDLKKWTNAGSVFEKLPAWHREIVPDHKGYLWAPDVIRLGDRYGVYYSVSGWGKNTSAIGLVSSPTLDPADPAYQWRDDGIVIRSTDRSSFNAIDPQLFANTDGRLWMLFGSFWSGIQMIELDPKSGLRHPQRQKVRQLAWNQSIEAPALLKHGDFYYLFVNWGLCCRGVKSTYEIRIGRSREITGPYLDADGNDLATGGGTLFLGNVGERIGPGHPAFIEQGDLTRMFYHYYDRSRNGFSSIGSFPLRWTDDAWPKPDETK
ncbi:MAG: arabinan endo-1,5-alpha-L-arabinosidase [Verrucomicrobiota bacterium]